MALSSSEAVAGWKIRTWWAMPIRATTSATRPKWGDAGAEQDFPTLLVAGVLPSCYKYRVFETIIPLRNMIWRPA